MYFTAMSGRFTADQVRCRRGHPKYAWDKHNFCIACREHPTQTIAQSRWADPCCRGQPCLICEGFTAEQLQLFSSRRSHRSRTAEPAGSPWSAGVVPILSDASANATKADRSWDRAVVGAPVQGCGGGNSRGQTRDSGHGLVLAPGGGRADSRALSPELISHLHRSRKSQHEASLEDDSSDEAKHGLSQGYDGSDRSAGQPVSRSAGKPVSRPSRSAGQAGQPVSGPSWSAGQPVKPVKLVSRSPGHPVSRSSGHPGSWSSGQPDTSLHSLEEAPIRAAQRNKPLAHSNTYHGEERAQSQGFEADSLEDEYFQVFEGSKLVLDRPQAMEFSQAQPQITGMFFSKNAHRGGDISYNSQSELDVVSSFAEPPVIKKRPRANKNKRLPKGAHSMNNNSSEVMMKYYKELLAATNAGFSLEQAKKVVSRPRGTETPPRMMSSEREDTPPAKRVHRPQGARTGFRDPRGVKVYKASVPPASKVSRGILEEGIVAGNIAGYDHIQDGISIEASNAEFESTSGHPDESGGRKPKGGDVSDDPVGGPQGPREILRADLLSPPTDFKSPVMEAIKYHEVMKVIQETLGLEPKEPKEELPSFAEAQTDKLVKRQQTALPLSKGVVNAANHFVDQLRTLNPVTTSELKLIKYREIPKLSRSYALDHPLYPGTLGREPAAVGTAFEQLCSNKSPTQLEVAVATRTVKNLEKLSREQVTVCSHLDLQLRTIQILNEEVLQSLIPGSEPFVRANKAKATLTAAARSVGALNHMSTHSLGAMSLIRRDSLLAKVSLRVPAPELNALRQSDILSQDLFDADRLKAAVKLDQESMAKTREFKSLAGMASKNSAKKVVRTKMRPRPAPAVRSRGHTNTVKDKPLPRPAEKKAEPQKRYQEQAPFRRGHQKKKQK